MEGLRVVAGQDDGNGWRKLQGVEIVEGSSPGRGRWRGLAADGGGWWGKAGS